MTTDQLTGRELDAAVAERMGCIVRNTLKRGRHMDVERGPGKWALMELPHYSTDISAAWEVLEVARGWPAGDGRWKRFCNATELVTDSPIGTASCVLMNLTPEIIARAFLAATETE